MPCPNEDPAPRSVYPDQLDDDCECEECLARWEGEGGYIPVEDDEDPDDDPFDIAGYRV